MNDKQHRVKEHQGWEIESEKDKNVRLHCTPRRHTTPNEIHGALDARKTTALCYFTLYQQQSTAQATLSLSFSLSLIRLGNS